MLDWTFVFIIEHCKKPRCLTATLLLIFSSCTTPTAPPDAHSAIEWVRGPDLPLARGGYFSVAHRGGLLIAGGTYWKDGQKLWTSEVSFLDPASGQWAFAPALPKPLGYGAMLEVDERVYLLGGCGPELVSQDIYMLDEDEWIRIGEIPAPLVYTAAVAVGKRIYVLGGSSDLNDLTQGTRLAWYLDLDETNGTWHPVEPIPGAPRLLHAAAAVNDSIYLFGGCTQPPDGPLTNLDDARLLDTATGKWTMLQPPPVAARAWWAVPVEGRIFLFGGAADSFLDTVYRYDPRSDEYHLVSRLPAPLADTKFSYIGGTFYGAGGEDRPYSRFPGTLAGRLVQSLD